MIQPINALTPRIGFRGSHEVGNKTYRKLDDESHSALINAVGISTIAGGFTTLVARSYTNSFAHAGVLGVFGAFLTMFFMTPHLVDKISLNRAAKKAAAEGLIKPETASKITTAAKEYAIPVKKLVQFRSEQTPTS